MNMPPDQPSHELYKAPEAVLLTKEYAQSDQYLNLLSEPRKCEAGWGLSWLTKAFGMFKDQFGTWLGIGVVYLIIIMVASFIPIVNILVSFLAIIFIGGVIRGSHAQATGEGLRFDHLFSAFSTHFAPLAILVLLYIVAIIIIMIPLVIIFGIIFYVMGSSDFMTTGQFGPGMLLAFSLVFLVAMLAFIPVMMALWFAPALIVLHDISPFDAMKMSFRGCLKNLLPFLVFGLVTPIIMMLGVIFTIGIGFLVIVPVGMITYYVSYRDVWTDKPLSVA